MSEADIRKSLWPKTLICYDVTLPATVENLALDEALLADVEVDSTAACLRFWQPSDYCVVLGRSNKADAEVDVDQCVADQIPILRRASGGGTVLIGPGCLCYSLALPITDLHRSMGVSKVTAELMLRSAAGLNGILPEVSVCGTSDLVWNGRKFSGNAQRWLRRSFIHHGTVLFDFDLSLVDRYLCHPTREPSYRESRRHDEFIGNFAVQSAAVKRCLQTEWNAVLMDCPTSILDAADRIAVSRPDSSDWKI